MIIMINYPTNIAIIAFDTCQFIVPYRITSNLSRSLGMASNTFATENGILLIW
jgi:hypothetical protein